MDKFELASVKGLMFQSSRGMLTTYDLHHLPLTSKRGDSLDSMAVVLHKTITTRGDVLSFVDTSKKVESDDELRLEIILHIIEHKKAANALALSAKAKKEQLNEMLELRDAKVRGERKDMSLEDMDALIAQLRE